MIDKLFEVKELRALLSWSKNRVSRNFKFHPRTVRDGKRFFVPESVVEEVLDRLRTNSKARTTRRGRPRGSRNAPRPGKYPPCPHYKSKCHSFTKDRCQCGFVRKEEP
jgi:hypothetical protein